MTTPSKWTRWVHPGRIRYAAYEWVIMRWLLVITLCGSFKLAGYDPLHFSSATGRGPDFTTQPKPRGIAQFVDVTWINHPQHVTQVALAALILLILLGLGLTPVIAAFGLAFLQIVIGTLENSQGNNVWHTSQILVFALLGIGCAGLADYGRAWRRGELGSRILNRWKWFGRTLERPLELFRPAQDTLGVVEEKGRSLAIYLAQQLMATAYVVSAISKLWISKGQWFTDVQFIGLQFEKNRLLKYYQTLEPPSVIPWAAEAVNTHPKLASVLFSMGLLLELLCFIALFNRGFLALFGIGLLVMHLMIAQLMTLEFYYNEWLLAIFYINIPFWLVFAAGKIRKPSPA